MSAYDTVNKLARELQESEEYKKFVLVKQKILEDDTNSKMIQDLQNKQWEIQQAQILGGEVSAEKQQELESLYSLLSLNPSTREYLEAEFRFSCLINDIQKVIGEAVSGALPIGVENLNI